MALFSRRKPEVRADSYTDTLVGLLVAEAGGSSAKATATAALEAAAGLVGAGLRRRRSRSSRAGTVGFLPAHPVDHRPLPHPERRSRVLGRPPRLTPRVPGRLRLGHHGLLQPRHLGLPPQLARPWRGVGPIESAALAGRLSAELANALADEASGTRGHVLPIPVDGEDPTVQKLKSDLRTLRGNTALVESQSTGNWTADHRQVRAGGWEPHRLGANPPEPVIDLHTAATKEIWAACGFPAALFSAADGTASREAWRQVLHGVLAPLGTLVAEEVSTTTGVAVELTWSEIRASDITGRSRAFASLIEAGASFESTALVEGLELTAGPAPESNPETVA